MRTSLATKIWLALGGLAAGLIIGLILMWARAFSGPVGEASLKEAKEVYSEGVQALESDQFKLAFQKCDEADRLATRAVQELVGREKATSNDEDKKKLSPLIGEAFWIKAQAMRDRFYAEKADAGEPIPSSLDTSTGERFRNPLRIADDKARVEAVVSQRAAFQRLPQQEEILLGTMRTEVSMVKPDWAIVEALAKATLEVKPKDARSLYLLARIDVEQLPSDAKGTALPTPEEKKSRERLLRAREYLTAPGSEQIPPFRKIYLEAQIAKCFRDHFTRIRKQEQSDREDRKLVELVLDPQSSALAQALRKNPDGKDLSIWDHEGVFGCCSLAVDRLLEDVKRGETDVSEITQTLKRFTEYATLIAEREPGDMPERAAMAVVLTCTKAQSVFETRVEPEWNQQIDRLSPLAQIAVKKKVASVALCNALSQLLRREGNLEMKRGNTERAEKLKEQSSQWLAESNKISNATQENKKTEE